MSKGLTLLSFSSLEWLLSSQRERELLREQTGRGFSLVSTCFCMVSGVECRCAFMMAGSATNEN